MLRLRTGYRGRLVLQIEVDQDDGEGKTVKVWRDAKVSDLRLEQILPRVA